ncbi:MAG: tRNA (adenosine(37)-N6)-threonylcarbamoyltransferase complex ATPase subunit type 1 TsaE [Candidatus Gribaldobacteria bacterium]|nr:tRNA (adenosine(37)-N6)-threonylcarbamoyltransferase complex ATPase subunit type 1 TsaE [Candidatus Gribaldobacteria bacterium]
MSNKLITASNKETQKLGQLMAKEILKLDEEQLGAFLIALKGDLGSGKTTFTQGLALGFGVEEKINSPTFVIMKRFELKNLTFKNLYHLDCYRIEKPEDLLDLGWKEIIKDSKNIIVIEWPEKIQKLLPPEIFTINFKFINENQRGVSL